MLSRNLPLRNSYIKMPLATDINHPYFPTDAVIPNYIPNKTSLELILRDFALWIVVFVASGVYLAKHINPAIRDDDLAAIAWYLLCKSAAAWTIIVC